MGKTFLIDGRIVFHSERKELYALDQPDSIRETLNEPCARCLEILLSSPGKIISQAELYAAGWENDDKEVSPNTLYQNILLARKALKNVSESHADFIITVPRKGFKFNDAISVTVLSETNNILYDSDKNSPTEKKIILKNKSSSSSFHRKMNMLALPLSGFAIMIAFGMFILSNYRYNNPTYHGIFTAYEFSLERNGCKFYINRREMMDETETNKLINTWPPLISDCVRYPLRYISVYRQHFRVFYLSCDTENRTNRTCRTGYFRP